MSRNRQRRKPRTKPNPQQPQPARLHPDRLPASAEGSGRKVLKLFIRDARYYPAEGSIVIVGEEVSSRRAITQQALVKDFIKEYGIQAREDDHEAWKFFARQLSQRKDPFTLVFLASKTNDDPI